MGDPSYPPPKPPVSGGDLAISTTAFTFVIGLVGLVVTVVQFFRRKRGWPFAVATLALCALAVFLGGVGYAAAAGA